MDNVQNVTELQSSKKGFGKMKKSTKITLIVLSIIFMLTAVIVPVVVFATPKDPGYQTVEKGDYLLRYRPSGDYYDIVSYVGTDVDVIVPAEIDGVKIRNILEGAFSAEQKMANKNIRSITIETGIDVNGVYGVEKIDQKAFEGCLMLTEMTIPSTVTSIGSEAFSGSGLQKLIVEDAGVLKLESNALTGANRLTTISINGGKVNGSNLSNYDSGINIDNIEIGDSVSEVSPDAFNRLNVSTLSVYNIDNDTYLSTSNQGEITNNITTVNILKSSSVLTSKFMDKVAAYCGKTVNTINVYPGINIIQSGAFTSKRFEQFANNGNHIYIEDCSVIDLGAFSFEDNGNYTVHLRKAGIGDEVYAEGESYSLNISGSTNYTTVTDSFMSKFDSNDLQKVKILNFSGKKCIIDENSSPILEDGVIKVETYIDDNNNPVVLDTITTFDSLSLSRFNYNMDGLNYIVFGNAVVNFHSQTFKTVSSPMTLRSVNAVNVSNEGLLSYVNIYGPSDYNSAIFKTFNRVSGLENAEIAGYKEIFLSRASYNTSVAVASKFITFKYVIDSKISSTVTVEAKIGDTLQDVINTLSDIKGYNVGKWYKTAIAGENDLVELSDEVVASNLKVTETIEDVYYTECLPIDVNYTIEFSYENSLGNEQNELVTQLTGSAKYGSLLNIKDLLIFKLNGTEVNVLTSDKYTIRNKIGNTVYGYYINGFSLGNDTITAEKERDHTYSYKVQNINSFVIKVYFDRPVYTVTFDDVNDVLTVKYGYALNTNKEGVIQLPKPTSDDGYEFSKWVYEGNEVSINTILTYKTDELSIELTAEYVGKDAYVTIKYINYINDEEKTLTDEKIISSKVGESIYLDNEAKNIAGYSAIHYFVEGDNNNKYQLTESHTIKNTNTVIYIVYTEVEYNILYYIDGEVTSFEGSRKTIKLGENYDKLPTPTKDGFTFDCWSLAEKNRNPVDGDTLFDINSLDGNTQNLYAFWTENTYSVTFDGLNGTQTETKTNVGFDDEIEQSYGTYDGYKFKEWTIVAGDETTLYDGKVVDGNKFSKLTTKDGGSVTITATWTPISYKITFTGEGVTATDKEATFNGDAVVFNKPTRNAYTFIGWSITGDYVSGSTTEITVDGQTGTFTEDTSFKNICTKENGIVTLTANWTPVEYTIEFASGRNGTITKKDITFNIQSESISIIPTEEETVANDGYGFNKYSITIKGTTKDIESGTYTFSEFMKAVYGKDEDIDYGKTTITLVPVFTSGTYTIIYDLDGGTATNPILYTVEETFSLNNPTKEGYTFAGWTGTDLSVATETVTIAKGSTGDRSYKATWTPNAYAVQFDLNGGSVSNTLELKFNFDSKNISIPIQKPTREGYNFTGWTFENNVTVSNSYETASKMLDDAELSYDVKEIKIIAVWVLNDYKITFDKNGADSDDIEDVSFNYNTEPSTITLPADPTKIGWNFVGWTINNVGGTSVTLTNKSVEALLSALNITDRNTPSVEVNLVANWEPKTAAYTVYAHVQNSVNGLEIANYNEYLSLTSSYNSNSSSKKNMNHVTEDELLINEFVNDMYALVNTAGTYSDNIYYYGVLVNEKVDTSTETLTLEYKEDQSVGMEIHIYFARKYVSITYTDETYDLGSKTLYYTYAFGSDETNIKTTATAIYGKTENGQDIAGWKEEASIVDNYSINSIINQKWSDAKSAELIAVWDAYQYSLVVRDGYDKNNSGDSSDDFTTSTKLYTDEVNLEVQTRAGYTFLGWVVEGYGNNALIKVGTGSYGSIENAKEYGKTSTITLTQLHSGVLSSSGETLPIVTVTAKWQANFYTFNFYEDSNNGTVYKSEEDVYNVTGVKGTALVDLRITGTFTNTSFNTTIQETTIKNGHKIYCWVVAGTNNVITIGTIYNSVEALLNDCGLATPYETTTINLVAVWEENTYLVEFTEKEGNTSSTTATMPESKTYNYNDGGVSITDEATKIGYSFAGWSFEDDTMVQEYSSVEDFLKAVGVEAPYASTTVTLYANWTKNAYNVALNANGGTLTTSETLKAYFDTEFNITNPTHETLMFAGWVAGTVDGEGQVTIDSNFAATYAYASNAPWAGLAIRSTTFKNLSTGAKDDGGTTLPTVTLTATWIEKGYNIEYVNVDNTTMNSKPSAATYGANVTIAKPEIKGYTFAGWTATGLDGNALVWNSENGEYETWDGSLTFETEFKNLNAAENEPTITFTATWTYNTYDINIDSDGNGTIDDTITVYFDNGSLSASLESGVTAQNIANVQNPDKTGYTFVGWTASAYINDARVGTNIANVETEWKSGNTKATYFKNLAYTGTVTLTAIYTEKTYQIIVNKNNSETSGSYIATFDKPEEIESPTRNGYTFAGWVLDSSNLSKLYGNAQFAYSISGETLVDAQNVNTVWTEIAENETYTNAIGAGKTSVYFLNLVTGADGYTSITLTATWAPNNYVVKFNSNGATGSMSNFEFDFESEVEDLIIPENRFTNNGYTFGGWKLGSAEGKDVASGSYTNLVSLLTALDIRSPYSSSEVTLYASWNKINYVVSFNPNDSTEGNGSTTSSAIANVPFTVESGKVTLPTEPTRTGYTFAGWSFIKDGATVDAGTEYTVEEFFAAVYDGETIDYSNTTIEMFANWSANTYKIYTRQPVINGIIITNDWQTAVERETLSFDGDPYELANPTIVGYEFTAWTVSIVDAEGNTIESVYNNIEYLTGKSEIKNITTENGAIVTLSAQYISSTYKATVNGDNTYVSFESNMAATTSRDEKNTATGNSVTIYANAVNGYKGPFDFVVTAGITEQINTEILVTRSGDGLSAVVTGYNAAFTVTVTATTIDYTISFNPNDSTEGNGSTTSSAIANVPFTVESGKVTLPTEPTRTGYTFAGWSFIEDGATVDAGTEYTVEEFFAAVYGGEAIDYSDTTIEMFANWEAITYTIEIYNGYEDDVIQTISNVKFDEPQEITEITRDGYFFSKWVVSGEGVYEDINGNKLYTESKSGEITTYTNLSATQGSVINLTAEWRQKGYLVEYANTGDTSYTNDSYDFEESFDVNDPEQSGYRFKGWALSAKNAVGETINLYTTSGEVIEGGTRFTRLSDKDGATVTLTAIWEYNTYTVYVVDRSSTIQTSISYYNDGKVDASLPDGVNTAVVKITLPSLAEADTGMHFVRFDVSGATVEGTPDVGSEYTNLTATNNAEVTFTAVWAENEYKVRINAGEGEGQEKELTFTYSDSPSATFVIPNYNAESINFVKTGYSFTGWTRTDGTAVQATTYIGITAFVTALNLDVDTHNDSETLTATWTPNEYTVTTNIMGTTFTYPLAFIYDDNNTTNGDGVRNYIPNAEKAGYTFIGWTAGEGFNSETAMVWNGTAWGEWDGEETKATFFMNLTATPNGEVELIAQFTPKVYNATISGTNATVGESDSPTSESISPTVITGTNLVVYVKADNGFNLDNISTNIEVTPTQSIDQGEITYEVEAVENGVYKVTFSGFVMEFSVTIEAEANKFIVAYDDGEATENTAIANTEFSYTDLSVTIKSNTYIREGYHFVNWVNKDGEVVASGNYTDIETLLELLVLNNTDNNETATLTATWELNAYTIIFDDNDNNSETNISNVTFNYGYSQIPIDKATLDDDYRAGYEFIGWTINIEGGTSVTLGSSYTSASALLDALKVTDKNASAVTVKLVANWEAIDVEYTINVYIQNEIFNAETISYEYTQYNSYIYSGKTDSTIPKNIYDGVLTNELGTYKDGLVFNETETNNNNTENTYEVTIAATGTEINLYYYRKTIEVTFTLGKYSDGTELEDSSDGNGEVEIIRYFSYEFSGTKTLPLNIFIITGKSIDKWVDEDDNEISIINDILKFNISTIEAVDAEARWSTNAYTISYDGIDEAIGYTENPSGVVDKDVTITSPIRAGYTFTGWTLSAVSANADITSAQYYVGGNLTDRSDVSDPVGAGLESVTFYNLTTVTGSKVLLTANWKENTYTIKFNAGEGSGEMSNVGGAYPSTIITIPSSSTFTAPTGKHFSKWTIGTQTVTAGEYTIKEFLEAYADKADKAYAQTEYTVTANYDYNSYSYKTVIDGNTSALKTVAYNQEFTISTPTKTGYTFASWTVSYNNGTATQTGVANRTFVSLAGQINTTGDEVTFTAVFTENTYTVKINLDGGKLSSTNATWTHNGCEYTPNSGTLATDGTATTVCYNATLSIANPAKTGYTFTGWTVTGTTKVTSPTDSTTFVSLAGATNTSEDTVTFTANWTHIKYTLVIIDDDGNTYTNTEVEYDQSISVDYPIKPGNTFLGYVEYSGEINTDAQVKVGDSNEWVTWSEATSPAMAKEFINLSTEEATITLKATFDANEYWVIASGLGDNADESAEKVAIKYEADVTATILDPTRTGYTFAGWTSENLETYILDGDDSTYYFARVKDSGLWVEWNGTTPTLESIKNLACPEDHVASDGTETITIIANWEVNHYELSVNLNGGKIETNPEGTYAYTDIISVEDPIKTGYTFDGWYVNGDNTKTQTSPFTKLATGTAEDATATIEAKWLENSYELVVSLDGGDISTNPAGIYDFIDTITVNVPTKDGYTFIGWTISNFTTGIAKVGSAFVNETSKYGANSEITLQYLNIGDYDDGNVTLPTVTLTANWEENSYNISFVMNGGTLGKTEWIHDETSTEGQLVSTTTNTLLYTSEVTIGVPTKEGYTFAGWTISNTSTTARVDGGAIVSSTKYGKDATITLQYLNTGAYNTTLPIVTLTANWEENSYTLSVNLDGGTVTTNPAGTYGFTEIVTVNVPTKVGYTFAGWIIGNTSTTARVDGGAIVSSTKYGKDATITLQYLNTGAYNTTLPIVTLTANWDINEYSVTVDPVYGTMTTPTYGVDGNEKNFTIDTTTTTYTIYTSSGLTVVDNKIIATDPTRATYVFQGWKVTTTKGTYTVSNDSNTITTFDFYTEANGFITYIEAIWELENHILTIRYEDMQVTNETTITVTLGAESYTISKGETATFTKSYSTENLSISVITNGTRNYYLDSKVPTIDSAVDTMSISWAPTADKNISVYVYERYTMSFDKNTGEGTDVENLYKIHGTDFTSFPQNELKLEGYNPNGWQLTNATLVGEKATTYSDNSDKTFYANWTENTYSVTIELNGGSMTKPVVDGATVEEIKDGETVTGYIITGIKFTTEFTLADPTRTGYNFQGWTPAGTVVAGEQKTTFAGLAGQENATGDEVTLTANWSDAINYTLTYDYMYKENAGDSSNKTEVVSFTINDTITLKDVTRTGYTFGGWYTKYSVNEETGAYEFADVDKITQITSTSTYVTVYAKWTPIEYKVIIMSFEAQVGELPLTFDETKTIAPISKPGYTFGGWTISGDFDQKTANITLVDGKLVTNSSVNVKNLATEDTNSDGEIIVTFTAIWTENTYSVTIELNGGSMTKPVVDGATVEEIKDGETVTGYIITGIKFTTEFTLADPTRTGYNFQGWTPAGTVVAGEQKTTFAGLAGQENATGDEVTLTATWSQDTYTLKINFNTDNVVADPTLKINSEEVTGTSMEFTVVYGTEYEFVVETTSGFVISNNELSTKGSTTNTYTISNWTVELNTDNKKIKNDTITLYVYETFTVTYYNNTPSEVDTYTAIYGEEITLVENSLTKTGYTANGWQTSNTQLVGTRVSDTVTVEDNLVYYANWTENTYSVTIELNGGTLSTTPTLSNIPFTQTINLVNPTRTGYTFQGWTLSNTSSYNMSTALAGGSEWKTLTTPNKATEFAQLTSYNTGTVTLTANWTADGYTITYNLDGGTATNPTSYTVESETFTLNNPTKEGYTFAGWTGSNGTDAQTTVTIAKGSTGIREYTANWTENQYKVVIKLAGGAFESNTYATYTYNNGTAINITTDPAEGSEPLIFYTGVVKLPVPTKVGYTFAGWTATNVSNTAVYNIAGTESYTSWTGTAIGDDSAIELRKLNKTSGETVTITANWEENSYTLSVNLDGGTVTTNPAGTYSFTDIVTVNVPTKVGYTFAGWTIGNTSTTARVDGGAIEESTKYGKDATIKLQYLNIGVYDDGTIVKLPTVTLTANWNINTYTLTYNLDGGTATNPTSYTVESETFTLNNPTKVGYTFDGWTGANGTTAQKTVTIAKGSIGNREYTANWSANTYDLTINVVEAKSAISNSGFAMKVNGSNATLTSGKYTVAYGSPYNFEFSVGTGFIISGSALSEYPNSPETKVTVTGWTAQLDAKGDLSNNIITLYVYETYTVEYMDNTLTSVGTYTAIHDENLTLIANSLTKTGYTANGWQTKADWEADNELVGTKETNVTVTSNLTYYANWTENTYTVIIDLGGGSSTAPTTSGTVTTTGTGYTITNVKFTDLIKLFDPTRSNYVFGGWELQSTSSTAKIDGILLSSIGTDKYDPTNGVYYNSVEDFIEAQYLRSISGNITLIAHWKDVEINVSIEGAMEFVYNEFGDPDGVYKLSELVDNNDELKTLYQSISMSQDGYTGTGVSIAHDLTIKMLSLSDYTFDGWFYITWSGTQSTVLTQISDIAFTMGDSKVENGQTYNTYTIASSDLAEIYASGQESIVICPKWTANIYTISVHTLVRYTSTNTALHTSNPYYGTLTVDGISGTVSFDTWLYSDKGISGINLTNTDGFDWKYGSVVQSQSDKSLFTVKVGRTGTVTLDPIAVNGYTFIGHSSTSYSGTTTDVSANGSYSVTNITSNSSIYYYFEANSYNLTVDYGSGTWVEGGVTQTNTKIIEGLIVDVIYNHETIWGDPYRVGYRPIGLVSGENVEHMISDYSYFYTVESGQTIEYSNDTFRYTSSEYNTQSYTAEVLWSLVPIWIEAYDSSGKIIANGANVGTVDTPITFSRYQYELSQCLSTGALGTLIAKMQVYLVKHDNPYTTGVVETEYTLSNVFTINSGREVILESLEITTEPKTQGEKIINISGQIVLEGGTLTFGENIKLNAKNSTTIVDVNSGTLNVVGVTIDGTSWTATANATTPVYLIDIATGATANINGVTFTNVTVGNGVIYSAGSTTFTDCEFKDNTVTNITFNETTD